MFEQAKFYSFYRFATIETKKALLFSKEFD